MERVVRERMTTQDVRGDPAPQTLINIRPVVASIKEFFGTSQLSQFMDQTNPLAGLTHKRRLSALGPGGLSRWAGPGSRSATCTRPTVRPDVPDRGRRKARTSTSSARCPLYGQVNEFGFVETPYRKVKGGKVPMLEIDYLTADEEDRHVIAQANAPLGRTSRSFEETRVLVRRKGGEVDYIPPDDVDYMDVSPRQMVSMATAMIPFRMEHDDACFALAEARTCSARRCPLLRRAGPAGSAPAWAVPRLPVDSR